MTKKKSLPAKEPEKSSAGALNRQQKERLFRGLLLLIPILFFVFLEGFLRLLGYGDSIPLFIPFAANEQYYAINPRLGNRYFPATEVQPAVARTDAFLREKPAGSFRIFALGASTAAGYPYLYNGSFSSMLKAWLAEAYPERQIEIVSLAMPAVSSYAVRELALKLADYQPDMLLVYAGHNEFYGGLGVASTASLGHSRWLVNTYLALRDYRLMQLLADALSGIAALFSSGEARAVADATLMERMAGDKQIACNSPLFRQANAVFRGNMEDVADFCRTRNIPLLIGSLASNMRDQPPFVDVHREDAGREAWQEMRDAAGKLFDDGNAAAALQLLDRCLQSDSLPASQYFLRGRIEEALGDSAAAYRSFYQAREHDGLRFRASAQLNRIINGLAAEPGVSVVPVAEAFAAASRAGLPGRELFLEHVHPNLRGYKLMTQQFGEAILAGGALGEPRQRPVLSGDWTRHIGVTAVDTAAASLRIRYLMSGWPFRPDGPAPKESFQPDKGDELGKLVWQYWNDEITWEKLHVAAARIYELRQNSPAVEAEYRALMHATPMNASPFLLLGQLLLQQQRFDEAFSVFSKSLRAEPTTLAYSSIGSLYLMRGYADEGITFLQRAIALEPSNLQTRFRLAQAFVLKKDYQQAKRELAIVRRSGSQLPGVPELAQFLEAQGRGNAPE